MKNAIIFKEASLEKQNLMDVESPEAGWMKMIPAGGEYGTMMFGVSEIAAGRAAHRWHDHVFDEGKGFEVRYPEGFEEIYYIISGSGLVQWKTEGDVLHEQAVGEGDTIVFPSGIGKHQLFNNSDSTLRIVFAGSKLPRVTLK